MSDVEELDMRVEPKWEQEVYQLREQVAAMRAENERLRAIPGQLIAMVEARAEWAQGVVQRNPSSPWQEVRMATSDALETMAENLRAFVAAKDSER